MKNRFVLRFHAAAILGVCLSAARLFAGTVTWQGGDATWTSPDSNSFGAQTYNDGDDVLFGDPGAGTVSITSTLAPGSVSKDGLAQKTGQERRDAPAMS